mgnify:CR=1 FL=1
MFMGRVKFGSSAIFGRRRSPRRRRGPDAAPARRLDAATVAELTAPVTLRIFFLLYPLVTNVAFEAFPCYGFENSDGYLAADVSIKCGSGEHNSAKALAIGAILLYPIGLLVLNGALLVASLTSVSALLVHLPPPPPLPDPGRCSPTASAAGARQRLQDSTKHHRLRATSSAARSMVLASERWTQ